MLEQFETAATAYVAKAVCAIYVMLNRKNARRN
jgi:hypothetical protein